MVWNRPVFFQAINIVTFIVTLAVNGLAGSTTMLNGMTSGEVSDLYPTLVTPVGFTFAVWGVIYMLLLAFIIYQALPKNRDKPFLSQIGLLFALSGACNVVWLLLWHYKLFTYSLVMMFVLLASLILIYLRLDIGRTAVPAGERWLVHLPFSIYLGWVSVATIANASSVLDFIGWSGWGLSPEIWTVIMLLAGAGLAAAMLFSRGDIAYALVIIWAFVGIAIKNNETPVVVAAASIAAGSVVLVLAAALILRRNRAPE